MCLKIDVEVLEKSCHTLMGSWHDFGRLSLEKLWHHVRG